MDVMYNANNNVESGVKAQAGLADRMEVSNAVKSADDKEVRVFYWNVPYRNSC